MEHPEVKRGRPEDRLDAVQREARRIVLDKMATGTYRIVERPCPVCGTHDFEAAADRDRYGIDYSVVICRGCDLLQVSPRLDEASAADFYREHYRLLYNGERAPAPTALGAAMQRGRDALEVVTSNLNIPQGSTIVEIGCGTGAQLSAFRSAGYRVVGYDIDEAALEVGRSSLDLDLRSGGLAQLNEDITAGDERPHVVTYIHVFEHLADPLAELDLLDRVLAPGGAVYVEVPGLRDVVRSRGHFFDEYLEIAHNFHFDRATITKLFARRAWVPLHTDHHVHGLFARGSEDRADEGTKETIRSLVEAQAVVARSGTLANDDEERRLRSALLRTRAQAAEVEFEVGRRYWEQGQVDKALDPLKAAYFLAPNRGRFALLLAQVLERIEPNSADRIEVCRAAAHALPAAANAHYHLGNAMQALSWHEEALGAYASAKRLRPGSAMFYYQAGICHQRLGRFALAIEEYQAAQSFDPSLAYAIHQEGLCWSSLGEFARAVSTQERAYAAKPVDRFLECRDQAAAALATSTAVSRQ